MKNLFTILVLVSLPFFTLAGQIQVGPDKAIRSIQDGIKIARTGDTVYIHAGIYKESTIIISKSITLLGIGYPVLDGEKKREIILVSGRNITIRGISFINSGYSALNDFASIKLVNTDRVHLINNKIRNAYFAIHVSNSTHTRIVGNQIEGTPVSEQLTGNGIHLWKCSDAQIEKNRITGHRDGIYFEFVTGSRIIGNHSEKNIRYGLHFMFSNDDHYESNLFKKNGAGVAVMYSKKVYMEKNIFEENWGASAYGLLLKDITDSRILHNTFYRNTTGIHMEGASRIEIADNQFSQNGWAMRVQASCDANRFHHNDFTGNSFDVGTNGSLVLNEFYLNYWDKYEGYDMNRDGIGDVPYHPVSMYSMIVEKNPTTLILFRSFLVNLLDRAEKAIPGLTPEALMDRQPRMKKTNHDLP